MDSLRSNAAALAIPLIIITVSLVGIPSFLIGCKIGNLFIKCIREWVNEGTKGQIRAVAALIILWICLLGIARQVFCWIAKI